jgi:hypothetical protein
MTESLIFIEAKNEEYIDLSTTDNASLINDLNIRLVIPNIHAQMFLLNILQLWFERIAKNHCVGKLILIQSCFYLIKYYTQRFILEL